jgi:hypothetical protein
MKKVFILWAVFFLLSSCDPATDTQQSVTGSIYVPGVAGDSYTYKEQWRDVDQVIFVDTITYSVVGPVERGGRMFMQYLPARDTIYLHTGPATRVLDTLYYRAMGDRVYRWQEDHEELYWDFGHNYVEGSANALPLQVMMAIPIIKTGGIQYNDCIILRGGSDGGTFASFAKNVGMISSESQGVEMSLMSANVGGVSIP